MPITKLLFDKRMMTLLLFLALGRGLAPLSAESWDDEQNLVIELYSPETPASVTTLTTYTDFFFTMSEPTYDSLLFIFDAMMALAPELFNGDPILVVLGSAADATVISIQVAPVPRIRPALVLFPLTAPVFDIEKMADTNETFFMMQSRDTSQPQISLNLFAKGETWASIHRFLQSAHEFLTLPR